MPVSSASHYYGLSSSGLDVDSLVKQLMQAQQTGYDKLWQQQQLVSWKKDSYNTVYTLANDFRDNTLFNFKMQSSLSPKTTSSTNSDAVTATANADAGNVTHSISVSQLATSAKLTSTSSISNSDKTSLSTQFGLDANTTYSLVLNDGTRSATISVTGSQTIYDLMQKINTAQDNSKQGLNIRANYDATLDRFFLYSTQTGSAAKLDIAGTDSNGQALLDKLKLGISADSASVNSTLSSKNSLTLSNGLTGAIKDDSNFSSLFPAGTTSITLKFGFVDQNGTVQNQNVTINDTDTIQTVLDNINAKFNVGGIQYSAVGYDSDTKRFQFYTNSSDALKSNVYFGTMDPATQAVTDDATTISFMKNNMQLALSGEDAKINLDGQALTESSNSFSISGVTYNLKTTTTNLTNPSVSIGVSPDIDKTIANVKSFVDTYNGIVKAVNALVTEKKYSDYLPLTDTQKSAMKDADITAWTAKAKSGILQSDDILSSLLDTIRGDFINPIKGIIGKYTSASSMGITTGVSFDANGKMTGSLFDGGQMNVDETKLRTALQNDPDAVYKLFGTADSDPNKQGIAVKLYSDFQTALKKISDRAGTPDNSENDTQSVLAKSLSDYTTRLADFKDRMTDMQNRYYNQFDALETALNQMNQQSSWIASQLGK